MSEHDVLIIGAGAAGLAAARKLSQAKHRVVILEARDRIGGRIHTIQQPGHPLPIELGAEFVHGKPPETWEIIRAAHLAANEVTEHHWHFFDDRLRNASAFWEDVEKVLGRLDENKPDQRFAEFFRTCCPDVSDAVRDMALMFVEGFNAARADRISTVGLARDQKAAEEIDETKQFRLIGGYGQVIDWLEESLGDSAEIRLNTIVRELRWRRGNVEARVESPAGISMPPVVAKRAIVTLPLGVLKDPSSAFHFNPDLPQKREAAQKLEMGPVVKIILQFRQAFWERDQVPAARGNKLPDLSFMHSRQDAVATWWTQSPIASTTLTGWAGGPKADALSNRAPREVLTAAIDSLTHMLGIPRNEIECSLQTWRIADWQSDPFSRGAYSYVPVGAGDARRELAESIEDTLFFAGEATHFSGQSGTVAGALASGYRAGEEVLGAR